MVKINRKNFILLLASSAAGIFLTSCLSRMGIVTSAITAGTTSSASTQSTSTSSTNAGSTSTETTKNSAETTSQKSGSQKSKKQALVGIAGSTGSLSAQVEKAVALAGGLGFIKKGSTVLIKPNFNTGDPHPASTNPEVIRHVIRLVKNQDPYAILIGDRSSYWTDTLKCMKKNGVYEVAEQEGAELYPFDNTEWIKISPAKAKAWPKGFTVPKILNEVDYVISIPVIKTHSIATFTMAIKNWVGILEPLQRTTDLHLFNNKKDTFGHMLAELHLARLPDFIIMDGTKVFVEGGPTEGKVVEAGLVVASNDIIANDTVGLAILKTLGTVDKIQDNSVWSQPQIARAVELELGARSIADIKISSENVRDIDHIISNLA
jgi:uncharacterized protein (DUF362 family)